MKMLTDEQVTARDARRTKFRGLAQQIAGLTDDGRKAMAEQMAGAVTVEGRSLSIGNACLLACQCPNATLVGGFRQWKTHGRSVRKGEHGLMIWAPVKGRSENGATPGPAELDADRPRFIMVTVFDVSQTEDTGHVKNDETDGRTIWNSDGTDGPVLICAPPPSCSTDVDADDATEVNLDA